MPNPTPQELQKQIKKTERTLREHKEEAVRFLSKGPLTGALADIAGEMMRAHERLQAEIDDLSEKLRNA
jgi:hypothetical protein